MGSKVLVVDDEQDIRELLKFYLITFLKENQHLKN